MKTLIAIAFLSSATAMACPALEGKYTCSGPNATLVAEMTKKSDTEFVFQLQGQNPLPITADNKLHQDGGSAGGSTANVSFLSSCSATDITTDMNVSVVQAGQSQEVSMHYVFSKVSDSKMKLSFDIRASVNGVAQAPANISIVCDKQ